MLQLFQTRDGPFFFIVTLVYTCRAFFAVSSKNIYPIYCFGHSSSQSVLQWNSFSPLKYIVYKCYSCFRPGMGHFFSSSHLSTLVALFCCIIKKYLSHILFWSQFVSVCFAMKFFFSFKIHCLQMLQLFQTRDGPFFSVVTLVYTCRTFFAVSSKNIYPIYCFGHSSSQSVLQWNSFSPLKYIVYKCYSCFRPGMGHFFSSSHLSRFFCCIIKKYLSHILFWWQFVSVCFAMKFFFSFKIHCLQMLQLFQTRDGPFFFIVTLVYTCRAFSAVSSKNINHIYCFGHTSSQSVLQWNSFSPLKYIVYKCYSCFRPGIGHFFHRHTCLHLSRFSFAVSSKNIYPIYCFGHSSSQSVSQWNSFSPLKYIVYKCYSCFRPGMGHFFSSSHLSRFFLLYHQKIFIPYIVLVTVRLSLFCNEILFLL